MNFLKKSRIFKITRFQKSRIFSKITRFQKSRYFQKSRDLKITLFQKSRDFKITRFLPFLIIFKTSVFLKKIPGQSSFWNSPFDNM